MNILLTGATGLLGNNALRSFLSVGCRVSCLVRFHHKPRPLADLDVELVYGDLSKPESLGTDALPDFEVLVHCAALVHLGWTRLEQSRQINVAATQQLAKCCFERRKRFVYVSTVDTLGYSRDGAPITETSRGIDNPKSAYVVSKTEGERAVIEWVRRGLDAVILHPGFMLGPYDWKPSSGQMLLEIHRRNLPFAPAGGCSAVDVRDVARGIWQAINMAKSGEHYILAGHNLTYLELFRMMARAMGRREPRWRLPDFLAMAGGHVADIVGRLRGNELLINSAAARMGQCFHYYNSSKACRDLNYVISPIEPAISAEWQWLVQNHVAKQQK